MNFPDRTVLLPNIMAGVWPFSSLFLSCLLLLSLFPQLHSQVLFQLGTFDGSSSEFSPIFDPATGQRRIDYANPQSDPVFVVGRDRPDEKWFSFQPGTANGAVGHRAHPFTIEFDCPSPAPASARLDVALLAYSTRLPALKIEIHGRQGEFFQSPVLDHRAGDPAVFFLPHYSTSRLQCDLPPHALQPGRNRIVLTAVDHPSDRDDVRPSGYPWPGNSGIIYDAILLQGQPDAAPRSSPALRVEPTIFFRKAGPNLEERFDLIVESTSPLAGATGAIKVAGAQREFKLQAPTHFGEQRAQVWIPAFSGTLDASVSLTHHGQTFDYPVRLRAARRWTLLLVPNEHLDVGYTDYESKVAELQSRTIDRALELTRQHPGFTFTLDGFWVAEKFLAGRSEFWRRRMREAVRKGTLQIPAVYGSGFTGFASLENLIRSLYPSAQFLHSVGQQPEFALITDVPSYSWSLASVLAAADIRYLVAASDAYRAPFLLYNLYHTTSPHEWEGPDGARVLTWYSRHYHQVASLFGMPPQILQGMESLPRFLQAYDHDAYPSSTVLLYGTQVENTELHPAQAELAARWNARFAYPKIEYSSFPNALRRIVAEGAPTPVHRGDGGPYWEDGLGANARLTALARRNMDRILTAEILSSTAGLLARDFRPDTPLFASAWRNLLLTDEHTWHADQSVREPESHQSLRQGEVKESRAQRAKQDIDHLAGRAFSALAETLDAPPGDWVVFNPLSWPRPGFIELDLPKGRRLIDAVTGQAIPSQIVFTGNGIHRHSAWIPEVGSVGYRVLRAVPASSSDAIVELDPSRPLENSHYRIEADLERGGLASLYDKQLQREWIDRKAAHTFNQHLHVTGADDLPNRLVQFSSVSPLPNLHIHTPTDLKVLRAWKSPVATHLLVRSRNQLTPVLESEYILHDHLKRLDIVNRLTKERSYRKEGVYFAYPLRITEPEFRHATQNGFVNPGRDMLPGAGLEWFIHQGWISASDTQGQALLLPQDAPLFTLGDIARGAWPSVFGSRPAHLYSYVMNNYTPEGYLAGQGGEFTFACTFTTGTAFDPVTAYRIAAEIQSPLEVNEITRNDRADQRQRTGPSVREFLRIEPERVALSTWKRAENDQGYVLRFLEISGKPQRAKVSSPFWNLRSVHRCNALELPKEKVQSSARTFEFDLPPFGIGTFHVKTSP